MLNFHWFQLVAYWVLAVFLGLTIYVIYLAYSRPSGYTGLDVAKIQQIRYESMKKNSDLTNK